MKEMVSEPVTSVERLSLMTKMITHPVTHLVGDILSTCSTVIYVEPTWLVSSLCNQQDSQNLVSNELQDFGKSMSRHENTKLVDK